MKRTAVLLAALILAALAAFAQLPRTADPLRNPQRLREHLKRARFTRTVTVATDGSGDYTSVAAACAFVATQSRDLDHQWTIIVFPGTYEEAAFTVPDRTVVRGAASAAAPTGITPIITTSSITSGVWITLAGHMADITLRMLWDITLTGATTAVQTSGFFAGMEGVQLQLFPSAATQSLIGIKVNASQFFYFVNSQVLFSGTSGTNATMIKTSGDASVSVHDSFIFGGNFGAAKGIHHNGTGTMYLYQTYIGGGLEGSAAFTADLTNDNGGTIKSYRSFYRTISGAVAEQHALVDPVLASPPATCDAAHEGWQYSDTSHAKCWCDGSTWQKLSGAGTCA